MISLMQFKFLEYFRIIYRTFLGCMQKSVRNKAIPYRLITVSFPHQQFRDCWSIFSVNCVQCKWCSFISVQSSQQKNPCAQNRELISGHFNPTLLLQKFFGPRGNFLNCLYPKLSIPVQEPELCMLNTEFLISLFVIKEIQNHGNVVATWGIKK